MNDQFNQRAHDLALAFISLLHYSCNDGFPDAGRDDDYERFIDDYELAYEKFLKLLEEKDA